MLVPNNGGGNDNLSGGSCADYLHGGGGNDNLTGGNGNDLILGGEGGDSANGGSGNDVISGGAGDDFIEIGGGTALSGDSGHDVIDGGTGSDQVIGGQGDDLLSGGFKSFDSSKPNGVDFDDDLDFLTGGGGSDVFMFTLVKLDGMIRAPGEDHVTDFDLSAGDILAFDLVTIGDGGTVFDAGSFTAADLDAVSDFQNTIAGLEITFNGDGSVVLEGYNTNDFGSFQDLQDAGAFVTVGVVQYV